MFPVLKYEVFWIIAPFPRKTIFAMGPILDEKRVSRRITSGRMYCYAGKTVRLVGKVDKARGVPIAPEHVKLKSLNSGRG